MSRVGQTMLATKNGRPVPVECIRDAGRVQWRSLDLQFAGDMSPDTWDEMRKAQREARREAGEDLE